MATTTKSNVKGTYNNWFKNLYTECRTAEDIRCSSYNHRQLIRTTCIETDIKTKYDQLNTNIRLSDRIRTVRQWRDELTSQLNRLKERIVQLKDAKHLTEEFMVKLNDLIGVNTECLTSLDRRCNGEYIDDPVFKELNQERNLLKDDLYNDLQLQINEAFHILIELNDVSQLFYPDITNKNEAIDIDIDVYNMNEKSSSVTFKPFYDHSSQQLLDLQTWENISRETLEKAKIIMNKADDLLHRLHNSLHITINRITNKTDQVNGVLRMRSYDTLRALREIEYQLKSVSFNFLKIVFDT
ncbi:unnamed protein product [Heterobilharzia americana]|nr:unnamed protein product [Heterobilharzia americana]